jgi:hypothetical protein
MAGFQVLIGGLRRAQAQLEKQLEGVRNAIASLTAGGGTGAKRGRPAGTGKRGAGRPKGSGKKRGRRKMSAAARKAISDAQKARWAKQKAGKK